MFKLMTIRRVNATTLLALGMSSFYSGMANSQEISVLEKPWTETSATQNPEIMPAPHPPAPRPEESILALQDESVEIMARGPLHEAFAEIQLQAPTPNPVIARKPPEPVAEIPPEYRPEGENIEWMPGYWWWEDDKQDFIWISGIWRDVPPGQRWVAGYWDEAPEGFRWVSGFWMAEGTQELGYLPSPPESLDTGPAAPAPQGDFFYAPGCWIYTADRYAWQPGYWMPRRAEFVWIPPTYIWTPRGCVFRPGYWDRLFDCRGVVFAPVCFRQPRYLDARFRYVPSCVINTTVELLPHLFVRRNCRQYYFGDWYDDRYLGGDFCAWSQVSYRSSFQRHCFDPVFAYYNSPSVHYHNRVLIEWVRDEHKQCHEHVEFRPKRTFDVRVDHVDGDHEHAPGQIERQRNQIAESLQNRVKISNTRADRVTFKQLDEGEREEARKRIDPSGTIARTRREIETKGDRDRVDKPQVANGSGDPKPTIGPKLTLPKPNRQTTAKAMDPALNPPQGRANAGSNNPSILRNDPQPQIANRDRSTINRNDQPILRQQRAADSAVKKQQLEGSQQMRQQLRDVDRQQREIEQTQRRTASQQADQHRRRAEEQAKTQRENERLMQLQNDAQQRMLRQQQNQVREQQRRAIQPSDQQRRIADDQAKMQREGERLMRSQRDTQERAVRQQQDQLRDLQRRADQEQAKQSRELQRQSRETERQIKRESDQNKRKK